MAIVTPLVIGDTFRTWLTRTNTAIDLLNSNTVIAGVNASGTFVVANGTSDITSTLTIHHATGGQTHTNATGLFLSGNTTFSGLNFTANATSNVFTVSSNTTLLESLGGTTINSALVASKTLTVTGAATFSNTISVTGASTFASSITSATNIVAYNSLFAKSVVFSETGAVVSDVVSYSTNNYDITGLAGASVLRINADARNIVLSGLTAPTNLTTLVSGGSGAKVLYLQNTGGTYKITLTHAGAASTDVNRFVGVGNADVVIPAGGAVTLLYAVAESRWRVLGQVEPHVTREQTAAATNTLTPNADENDICTLYAQAGPLTIANPSPAYTVVQGQKLIIRITDDGTNRALDWTTSGSQYRAIQSSLPATTTASKILYLGFIYNATDTKWDLVANAQEA